MIDPNVTAAIVSSTSSMVVAVVALVLNHSASKRLREEMDVRFTSLGKVLDARFGSIEVRFTGIDQRLERIEHRLDRIEADLKDFDKTIAHQDVDIGRLKDKAGLS